MARKVRVELAGPRNCGPLIEYLEAQGLAGRLVETNDRCELEVEYAVDAEERLRSDVWHALRSWVAARDGSLVLAEVGQDSFVLRPPGE